MMGAHCAMGAPVAIAQAAPPGRTMQAAPPVAMAQAAPMPGYNAPIQGMPPAPVAPPAKKGWGFGAALKDGARKVKDAIQENPNFKPNFVGF